MDGILKNEFMSSDPAVAAVLTDEGEAEEQILDFGSVNRVIFYLRTVPNGIQNMSQVMHGMVETSLNLGIMELLEEHLHTVSSVRSSVGTRKTELCERVNTVVEMVGGETEIRAAINSCKKLGVPLMCMDFSIYKELTKAYILGNTKEFEKGTQMWLVRELPSE